MRVERGDVERVVSDENICLAVHCEWPGLNYRFGNQLEIDWLQIGDACA